MKSSAVNGCRQNESKQQSCLWSEKLHVCNKSIIKMFLIFKLLHLATIWVIYPLYCFIQWKSSPVWIRREIWIDQAWFPIQNSSTIFWWVLMRDDNINGCFFTRIDSYFGQKQWFKDKMSWWISTSLNIYLLTGVVWIICDVCISCLNSLWWHHSLKGLIGEQVM